MRVKAELDLIGGGLWTVPALGLQDLSYGSRTGRKWAEAPTHPGSFESSPPTH